MSYLLGKSEKIQIGTAGLLLPYYNPIKLAEEIAVIKSFDDGRFMYGIAKGAFTIYDKVFNADGAVNREVMFEANDLIHRLLLEERVSFDGKFFSCSDVSIRPKIKSDFTTYLASESMEAIKRCANGDYEIIGSLAVSRERIREILDEIRSISPDKKPKFRVARGLNIGKTRSQVKDETCQSAEVFLRSMMLSKDTNPTLVKLLSKEYLEARESLFDSNAIFENAIYGTPQECIEQIRSIQAEFDLEALLLKPLVTSQSRAKEVLDLYVSEVKPYV